jgi:hypothetical protein
MRSLLGICLLLVTLADGCGQSGDAHHYGSLIITVKAGPTCPVERIGDPACAPRPVNGARLRLDGASEMTLRTGASGTAGEDMMPVGAYLLAPQPVNGLMGTPAPMHIVITQDKVSHVQVSYDTGIR